MANLSFYAVCPFGLEELLAGEISACGAERIRAARGGVSFSGSAATAMAAHWRTRSSPDAPALFLSQGSAKALTQAKTRVITAHNTSVMSVIFFSPFYEISISLPGRAAMPISA